MSNFANPELDNSFRRIIFPSNTSTNPSIVFANDIVGENGLTNGKGLWWEIDGIHFGGLGTPVDPSEVATKDYVDTHMSSPGITELTGDVTAGPGSGSQVATVVSIGGSSAASVNSAEIAANAATNLNTVSTIVKRDGSGNFSAGTITASLIGVASGNLTSATGVTSLHADASANLHGDARLVSGLNIALSQVGQDITVNTTTSITAGPIIVTNANDLFISSNQNLNLDGNGIGGGGATYLTGTGGVTIDLYANNSFAARCDDNVTLEETRFLLWDITAGSLVRVSRGAADSGGTGFRVLRIPN